MFALASTPYIQIHRMENDCRRPYTAVFCWQNRIRSESHEYNLRMCRASVIAERAILKMPVDLNSFERAFVKVSYSSLCHMHTGMCRRILPRNTSLSSFLVVGGGGQDPQMYRQKTKRNLYARASEARSASDTYICRSPNTSAHTINAVPFYYLWHGAVLYRQYNDKILKLRINASERSERA